MNQLVRVLVFLGAPLLVLAVMALLGVRSGDRSAFQKFQAELRAKWEKLTFAELTRGRTRAGTFAFASSFRLRPAHSAVPPPLPA